MDLSQRNNVDRQREFCSPIDSSGVAVVAAVGVLEAVAEWVAAREEIFDAGDCVLRAAVVDFGGVESRFATAVGLWADSMDETVVVAAKVAVAVE